MVVPAGPARPFSRTEMRLLPPALIFDCTVTAERLAGLIVMLLVLAVPANSAVRDAISSAETGRVSTRMVVSVYPAGMMIARGKTNA